MQLEGQVALVTGVAQGIGRATAAALAEAGCQIAGVDLSAEGADSARADVEKFGRPYHAIAADVGDVGAIDAFVAETMATFGRIDILVNNAGVTRRAHIMDLTEEDWDRIHRVNAKGVFFCMQRVAREMMAQGGGRIINMASIAGKGYVGSSNVIYAGSKGAVIAMTRLGALQLAPHNINVNAVCPGATETAIYTGIVQRDAERDGISIEEARRRAYGTIPLGRPNTPEDVAALVVYLASPAARNVTGQSINIDGGLVPD